MERSFIGQVAPRFIFIELLVSAGAIYCDDSVNDSGSDSLKDDSCALLRMQMH